MATTHIEAGDIVILRSDPKVKLTVTDIEGSTATVAWFYGGEIKQTKIMAAALVKAG